MKTTHPAFSMFALLLSLPMGLALANPVDESLVQEVVVGGTPAGADLAAATFSLERVLLEQPDLKLQGCSGTLIAKDIILTAAHCLHENKAVGLFVKVKNPRDGSHLRIEVIQSFAHPEYQLAKVGGSDVARHDIALLKLKSPVPGGRPALLPREDFRIADGTAVVAAGFGISDKKLSEAELLADPEVIAIREKLKKPNLTEKQKTALVLQLYTAAAKRPLLRGDLRASIRDNQYGGLPYLRLEGKQIICSGDSGGPSYIIHENRLVVVGVHSTGTMPDEICEDPSKDKSIWEKWKLGQRDHFASDVYVPYYVNWIHESMAKLRRTQDL